MVYVLLNRVWVPVVAVQTAPIPARGSLTEPVRRKASL